MGSFAKLHEVGVQFLRVLLFQHWECLVDIKEFLVTISGSLDAGDVVELWKRRIASSV